ncbi:hypothetical protein TELCIR_24705, partial [Teladorsagia circumcincta]
SCSHCQVNVHKPHRTKSPSHVPPSAIKHETSELGYGEEVSNKPKSQPPQPSAPARPSTAQKKHSSARVRPTPAPAPTSPPSQYSVETDTTDAPAPPAPSYAAESLTQAPVRSTTEEDLYQPPSTTSSSTSTTTTSRPVESSTSYNIVIEPTENVQPSYGDEPTEPVTPEPDQPKQPIGYSNDQLFIMSPARAYSQRIVKFDHPTVVRTKQGYNVQLVPSSYGANPIGRLWDAGTPTKYNPAHYKQLAPPAPRYKRG